MTKKEQIIAILQKHLQLDMPNPDEAETKVADEIVKLYQCKNIISKVKEANTFDKRSFEEAEADKAEIRGEDADCNNCKHRYKLIDVYPCDICNLRNFDKWEPIKTE